MKFEKKFILFFALLWSLGCNSGEHNHEHHNMSHDEHTEEIEVPVVAADSTTLHMIEKYKEAITKLYGDDVNQYMYSKLLETIDNEIEKADGYKKIELVYSKAQALLNFGDTDASIDLFLSLSSEIKQSADPQIKNFEYFLNKQLAIAYMRKAEQENCIINHNEESCIIPFSELAQHKLREGSEKTIEILMDLLKMNPNDKDTQYLLNIAHMTLGTYPDKVPQQYRIPESYFQTEEKFPQFKDVATGLGVGVEALSGGTCLEDFNNDGYLDIMASSWGFDHQIRYFENNRRGGFTDMTNATGLLGVTSGLNLRHADYNNDGHIDFLILRGAWLDTQGKIPNSLIRNNGDGTFTDVTIEAGVYSLFPTQTAVWADFNLDGWLDIFIANESNPESINECELFVNQGDGTFVNKIKDSGILVAGYFKGVAVGDINNDRYPDIYLSNLMGDNFLMVNESKDSAVKFGQLTVESDLKSPRSSFPTWMFDYNNDGKDDIFVSGYSLVQPSPATLMMNYVSEKKNENRPYLFKNLGKGRFAEVSLRVGLDEPVTTMGCNFGDLNNDGYLDFYLATGSPDFYSIVPNKMYLNNEGKSFKDITYSSGFGHIQKGHAVGFADLDMDGDQDIYTVMGGAYEGDVYSNLLFENPIGNKNNWINIKVAGKNCNASAIGAKLILTITEKGEQRKIYHNVGYDASFGGNSLLAEIGIGKAKKIDNLEILWPSASLTSSTYTNIKANQHIRIVEGDTDITVLDIKKTPFVQSHTHHH